MITHTSKLPFDALLQASETDHAAYRRHYRSRNLVAQTHAEASQVLRPDNTRFDDSVILSLHKGSLAAKRNIVPAIFTLTLMALLAWAFYSIPAVDAFFNRVSVLKQNMGISFAIIASGLCVGLLSESIGIISSGARRWTIQNTLSFGFLFLTFGLMSAAKDPIFVMLAELYGEGNGAAVLIKKTLFDQFVWTVFLACPYQTLLFAWKNHNYSFKKVKEECPTFNDFFAVKMLPVLISNWAFWIPMSAIIYSFPTDLQLAVSIIAISLWVCILNMLTKSKAA